MLTRLQVPLMRVGRGMEQGQMKEPERGWRVAMSRRWWSTRKTRGKVTGPLAGTTAIGG